MVGSVRQLAALVVFDGWRLAQGPGQVTQLADASIAQPVAHLLEARQRAAIVGHKQMQPGTFEGALHQCALLGIQRHGFFDTTVLAGGPRPSGLYSRWLSGGVAMYTASTSGSLISAWASV